MPYKIQKSKRTGLYRVINTKSGKVMSKGSTLKKAQAQVRLLEQIENRYRKKD